MKKKIISVFLILILVLGFTSCKDKNVVDEINKEVEKNQLQIFKTDFVYNQELRVDLVKLFNSECNNLKINMDIELKKYQAQLPDKELRTYHSSTAE